jgi:hypothetical protein
LQELVLGRIGSRLKSSWYFPPMQQQLLQSHQEDGPEEDQAAAEQAAAAAAGQAAGSMLDGVVSRHGSRLVKDAAAAGLAVASGLSSSATQQCELRDEQIASEQQQMTQQNKDAVVQRADAAANDSLEHVGGVANEDETTCVEVQVLLVGTEISKQQRQQERSAALEQLP